MLYGLSCVNIKYCFCRSEERDRNEQQHEKSTMEVIQERDQVYFKICFVFS